MVTSKIFVYLWCNNRLRYLCLYYNFSEKNIRPRACDVVNSVRTLNWLLQTFTQSGVCYTRTFFINIKCNNQ